MNHQVMTSAAEAITVVCVACRAVAPLTKMEPVPTSKYGEYRCADEAACRGRYTPRRFSYPRTEEP